MSQVDLCVVNFNTYNKLVRLCAELATDDSDPDLYTLLVADNGSIDNSVQMLEASTPQNISKVVFNDNIGYASACNQLAAMGSAPIVGLLNSDVWLNTKKLRHIISAFEEYPEIAILGPKQLDERNHITHAGIEGDETTARPRGWKIADPKDRKFKELKEMVSVSGSAYFVRREIWDELTNCPIYQEVPVVKQNPHKGAFLPTPHYYEETFCSYHARAHGYKVFYDGRVSIGHSWHASHAQGSKYDRMMTISKKLFQAACDSHGIPHN